LSKWASSQDEQRVFGKAMFPEKDISSEHPIAKTWPPRVLYIPTSVFKDKEQIKGKFGISGYSR
jgi:hypothetical protein